MGIRNKSVVLGCAAMVLGTAGVSFGFSVAGETLSFNTSVGTGLQLLANTPGQKVQVLVAGGLSVAGEDLNVQINGGISGPTLTSADFKTGTIFASNNTFGGNAEQQAVISTPELGTPPGIPAANQPYLIIENTTVGSGSVVGTGLLATLTIDTTGLSAGSTFALNMLGTMNGDSDFAIMNSTPIKALEGSNTISLIAAAPEPTSVAFLAVGSLLMVKRRRRLV